MSYLKCLLCFLLLVCTAIYLHAEEDLIDKIAQAEQLTSKAYPQQLAAKESVKKLQSMLERATSDRVKHEIVDDYIKSMNRKIQKKSRKVNIPLINQLFDREEKRDRQNALNRQRNIMNSLVIIEGKYMQGTGFVTHIGKKKVVVTNAHVVFGNANLKLLDSHNNQLKIKRIYFAKDRDIAVFWVDNLDDIPALPLKRDVGIMTIGSSIDAYGNSLGVGSHSQKSGCLQGIGGHKIEISARIVPGNSGGPILDSNTNEVIGVSTHIIIPAKQSGSYSSDFSRIRSFGTRLDTLEARDFERINPKKLKYDIIRYRKLCKANQLAAIFLHDISESRWSYYYGWYYYGRGLDPHKYAEHKNMKQLVKNWNEELEGSSVFKQDFSKLLSKMRNKISQPAKHCQKTPPKYAFAKQLIKEKVAENKFLLKRLETAHEYMKPYNRDRRSWYYDRQRGEWYRRDRSKIGKRMKL